MALRACGAISIVSDQRSCRASSGSARFPKGVVHSQRSVGTAVTLGGFVAKANPEPNGRPRGWAGLVWPCLVRCRDRPTDSGHLGRKVL